VNMNHNYKFGENREEKIDKFLDNLAWAIPRQDVSCILGFL